MRGRLTMLGPFLTASLAIVNKVQTGVTTDLLAAREREHIMAGEDVVGNAIRTLTERAKGLDFPEAVELAAEILRIAGAVDTNRPLMQEAVTLDRLYRVVKSTEKRLIKVESEIGLIAEVGRYRQMTEQYRQYSAQQKALHPDDVG